MKSAVTSPEVQGRSSFKAERVQLAPGTAGKPTARFKAERVQMELEIAPTESQFARRVSRMIEEFQRGWESR